MAMHFMYRVEYARNPGRRCFKRGCGKHHSQYSGAGGNVGDVAGEAERPACVTAADIDRLTAA